MLGNDSGIESRLENLKQSASDVLVNEAKTECDRSVRERPEFYAEEINVIYQLRQTLQQACRGYDYQSMIECDFATIFGDYIVINSTFVASYVTIPTTTD